MTNITQIISYSLISSLGLFIFFTSIIKWIKNRAKHLESSTRVFVHPFITAITVGLIPCPGMVMVMLFAMSMDLTWLGILLGATISFGMATTITLVLMAGISGKTALFSLASRHTRILTCLEYLIGGTAG